MANKLIQWNCRGLKANFNELLLLLTGLCPSIMSPRDFFLNLLTTGGSSIVVNNSVPESLIPLNTNLQDVAVKVTLHKTLHACSIYLPSGDRFDVTYLERLLAQLPKPFINMGDFNSHFNVWGCRDTDHKGRIIEYVINRNNILLYNTKSYTYLHPGIGT